MTSQLTAILCCGLVFAIRMTAVDAACTPATSSLWPVDCSLRGYLITPDARNQTALTIAAYDMVYNTSGANAARWTMVRRLGFNSYWNIMHIIIWGSTAYPTLANKIDNLVAYLSTYSAQDCNWQAFFYSQMIGCWGTIGDFVACGNVSSSYKLPDVTTVSPLSPYIGGCPSSSTAAPATTPAHSTPAPSTASPSTAAVPSSTAAPCSTASITLTPGDGTNTVTPTTTINSNGTLTVACTAGNGGTTFMQFNNNQGGPLQPIGETVTAVLQCVNGQWTYVPGGGLPNRTITEVNCISLGGPSTAAPATTAATSTTTAVSTTATASTTSGTTASATTASTAAPTTTPASCSVDSITLTPGTSSNSVTPVATTNSNGSLTVTCSTGDGGTSFMQFNNNQGGPLQPIGQTVTALLQCVNGQWTYVPGGGLPNRTITEVNCISLGGPSTAAPATTAATSTTTAVSTTATASTTSGTTASATTASTAAPTTTPASCSVDSVTLTSGDGANTVTPVASVSSNGTTMSVTCTATSSGGLAFMQFNTNQGGPLQPIGQTVTAVLQCTGGQWVYAPSGQTSRVITEVNCIAIDPATTAAPTTAAQITTTTAAPTTTTTTTTTTPTPTTTTTTQSSTTTSTTAAATTTTATCPSDAVTLTAGDGTNTVTPTSTVTSDGSKMTITCKATTATGLAFMQFNNNQGGPLQPIGQTVTADLQCTGGQWVYAPAGQTSRVITEVNCINASS